MSKLVVDNAYHRSYRIYWEDDGDLGGHLCQDQKDGTGEAPQDRDEWEHWAASRAVRQSPGVEFDLSGAFWELERDAKAALRLAREALKQDRPLPDWAQKALAEGWKPPKGWKA